MKEFFKRLWLGDICKKCGHRLGIHTPVRDVVTIYGEYVDRDIKYTRYVCP